MSGEDIDRLVDEACSMSSYKLCAQIRNHNPDFRSKNAEAIRNLYKDSSFREKNRIANIRLSKDKAWREANIKAIRKRASPVFCVEVKCVYMAALDAERETGIPNPNIIAVCRGKRKTAGGYHWRYATPEEAAKIKGGTSE